MTKYKSLIIPSLALFISIYGTTSFASYMQDAKISIEKGEVKKAKIHLKNQLKSDPKDAEARYLLGMIYLQSDNMLAAEKELQRANKLAPEDTQKRLSYAQILLNSLQFEKIPTLLNKPIENKDHELIRLKHLAYGYLGLSEHDKSRHYFQLMLKQNKGDIDAHIGLAKIALAEKDMVILEQHMSIVLGKDPQHTEGLLLKARLSNNQSDYATAAKIYNTIIEKNPENISVYYDRALSRLAVKNLKGAQDDINYIKNKIGIVPEVNYIQSRINFENNDFKGTQIQAQEVYKLNKRHFPTILLLGISNFRLGNYNQAQKYLLQYADQYPKQIQIKDLLAKISLIRKELMQASRYYKQILDIDSTNANAYKVIAAITENNKGEKAAERYLQTALENNLDNLATTLAITSVFEKWYVQHAQHEKLIPLAVKINKKHPGVTASQIYLAKAYILNKKDAKAEKVLLKIISKNKDDIESRIILAKLISSNKNKKNQLLKLLDEIFTINTKNPQALIIKAEYLIKQHDYPVALKVINSLKSAFPLTGEAEKLKGDLLLSQKKKDAAIVQYLQAAKVNNKSKILLSIIIKLNTKASKQDTLSFLKHFNLQKNE